MTELTYPEVGGTRAEPLPSGYRHLRHRTVVGRGVFEAAAESVLTWRMHRATGARVDASGPRAEPGVTVVVGLGLGRLRMSAPCRVVWVVADDRRAGFAYGTLPGHPARGEEAFLVEEDADGQVRFSVTAFSKPASRLMRAAGPLGPQFQHAYAWWCGRALRRLCTRAA